MLWNEDALACMYVGARWVHMCVMGRYDARHNGTQLNDTQDKDTVNLTHKNDV
jgi:hypothetical protein